MCLSIAIPIELCEYYSLDIETILLCYCFVIGFHTVVKCFSPSLTPDTQHTYSTEGRKKRGRGRGWRRTVMVVGRVIGRGGCRGEGGRWESEEEEEEEGHWGHWNMTLWRIIIMIS